MVTARWLWTGIAAAAAAVTAGAAVLMRSDTKHISLPEVSIQEASAADAANVPLQIHAVEDVMPTLPDTAYLIQLSGDVLSVYAEGSKEPLEQYELPSGWLPEYDRILLEYGLRVQNTDELRELMEDYLS